MKLPWWIPFGRVPEIAAGELADQLRGRPAPQLLDIRTPAEFAAGRIRGAVNVPLTVLPSRLDALGLDRTRPVVAVCLSAHRSAPAVRLLGERGFQAVQLAGGMIAWRAAGLPEIHG
jgi:rhodanese-related sulfurtransferase